MAMEIGIKGRMDIKKVVLFALEIGLTYYLLMNALEYLMGDHRGGLSAYVEPSLVIGVLAGFVIFLFTRNSAAMYHQSRMKIFPKLGETELLEAEGPATLYRGWIPVSGILFLTNEKMIFVSPPYKLFGGRTEIPYKQMKTLFAKRRDRWSEQAGLRIESREGKHYIFAVPERDTWMALLSEKISRK